MYKRSNKKVFKKLELPVGNMSETLPGLKTKVLKTKVLAEFLSISVIFMLEEYEDC